MQPKKYEKGQVFDRISQILIGIASSVVILVVVFLILAQGQDQVVSIESIDETNTSTWTTGYNATTTLTNAVSDIPDWFPIIIIVSIGAILIGLVSLFRR